MKIHHLGLATAAVDDTLAALGLSRADIVEVVEDHNQQNRLHFIHLVQNDMWLELVEPMSPTASVAKFTTRYRVGLHHLGFDSPDIDARRQEVSGQAGMFPLKSYAIDVRSFGGAIRTFFVGFHGLILEYVQRVR
jgi:hypothetical protein